MVKVAPALLRDLPALLELERRCFPRDEAWDRVTYQYALERAHAVNLKLVEDGRLIGFAGAFLHDGWRTGHVYTVNVLPEARGRGLGRTLVEALEAHMRQAGMQRSVLEVNVRNAPAIRLYEWLGYERRGRLHGYYENARSRDAYAYEKGLISRPALASSAP